MVLNKPAIHSSWRFVKDEVVGKRGIVCAETPLSAAAGAEMYAKGGNAVDAAVAATFAAGVVEPASTGIGGNSNTIMHLPQGGGTLVVTSGVQAPRRAASDMFQLEDKEGMLFYGWRPVRDSANLVGHQSAVAPTLVLGLEETHRAGGFLPWAEVLEPAIRYAAEGFDVDGFLCLTIAQSLETLRRFPATRVIFTQDGLPMKPGSFFRRADRIVNAELADSLRAIAREGSRVLTHGYIADAIADEMRANGGLVDRGELAQLRASAEPARVVSYREFQIGVQPSTVWQAEVLNILEGYDLPSMAAESSERVHLLVEAYRRAFADFFAYVGDTDDPSVPLDVLASKVYADQRRASIEPERSPGSAKPGDPGTSRGTDSFSGVLDSRGAVPASRNTTNVTTADSDGNLVTINSSLCAGFGSGVVVPGTGILLNDYMIGFNPEPGHALSISPGKKLSGLGANLVVLRRGQPFAAIGAPGAWRASAGTMQSILNVIDHKMGIQAALSAPRIYCEHTGDLFVDSRMPSRVIEELRSRGHSVAPVNDSIFEPHFGRPLGVLLDTDASVVRGGVHEPCPAIAMAFP